MRFLAPVRTRRRRAVRLACVLPIVALLSAAFGVGSAGASQLIDRNAKNVKLAVNANGEALLTYRVGSKVRRVLAWGALDAIAPTPLRKQVAFNLDYSGGYGKYRSDYWKTFRNSCRPYAGPALAWPVTSCTAPDGSYWAIQSWQRALPNLGVTPTPKQAVWELRLSHWAGPLPELEIEADWAYRKYDHLFGTLTYAGKPQYGFHSTSTGEPLDTFGRNIYLDTFGSAYGPGWKRENSFLTHTRTGAFCYGLFPHEVSTPRPAGNGTKYRATVIGPGVTPDVMWVGEPRGPYDRALDARANDLIRGLQDKLCKPN